MKQVCVLKVCPWKRLAPPASTSNPTPGLITTKKIAISSASKTSSVKLPSKGNATPGKRKRGRPSNGNTLGAKRAKTVSNDDELKKPETTDNDRTVFTFKISSLKAGCTDQDAAKIRKWINLAVRDPEDYKAQDKTCEQLRKCITSIESAKKLVLFGGIEIMCNAMRNHSDKSIVIAEGCCTLAALAWILPEISPKMIHLGVVNLIISSMNNWQNNSNKVLQMGCAALRSLSYDEDTSTIINKAGGLETVIKSLECNANRFEVQKQGCHFLQNMIVRSTDTAKVISKSQVIPIFLETMSKIHADAEFKQAVCGLISKLALLRDTTDLIGTSGAISVIIDTLNTTTNQETAQAACSALKHLATGSDNNQSKISQAGGISSAFHALESYPNDPILLASSLNLIKELCMSDEETARTIAKMGKIKTILKAMETKLDLKQYDLATIQVAAISVVGYLIFEGKDEKIAPKFVKKIVEAMKDHSDDGELQIRACDALFELSQVPTSYTVLKEKQTQELLLRAKNHFKPCESDVDDIIASCKKPRSSSRKIIVTTSECSRKTRRDSATTKPSESDGDDTIASPTVPQSSTQNRKRNTCASLSSRKTRRKSSQIDYTRKSSRSSPRNGSSTSVSSLKTTHKNSSKIDDAPASCKSSRSSPRKGASTPVSSRKTREKSSKAADTIAPSNKVLPKMVAELSPHNAFTSPSSSASSSLTKTRRRKSSRTTTTTTTTTTTKLGTSSSTMPRRSLRK